MLAKITLPAVLLGIFAPSAFALSHSNMKHPDPSAQMFEVALAQSEDHVFFGNEPQVSPKVHSDGSQSTTQWRVATAGASWHVWSYDSIVDRLDMPLWPEAMGEVRIILSSEACRQTIYLPQAPFMAPRGLEHCGVHLSATTNPRAGNTNMADTPYARLYMRRWMSQFMEWTSDSDHSHLESRRMDNMPGEPFVDDEYSGETEDDVTRNSKVGATDPVLGPGSFIDLGNSSIYYFQPFARSHALDGHQGSRLDLMHHALSSHTILRDLPSPRVLHSDGSSWLDNHRVEITLRRTPHGFVKVSIQTISLIHPSDDIRVHSLANATSQFSWIGPTLQSRSYSISASTKERASLDIAEAFYAQHDTSTQPAGVATINTRDFFSFHPSLHVVAEAAPNAHLSSGTCHIEALLALPPKYFFDPYQLNDQSGQLGMAHHHYGPVELEKPAESMPNWGSMLRILQYPRLDRLDVLVPLHARYRLTPIQERTVGYNGESDATTHVETSLLPPIVAVLCPKSEAARRSLGNALLDKLVVRVAVFDELGLMPVSGLETSPDTDMLLRMPVGDAQHSSLIRNLTLAALFAGTLFVILAIRRSTRQSESLSQGTANSDNKKAQKDKSQKPKQVKQK